MQECRFCKEKIKDGDEFCQYCGYDPKMDRVNPHFMPSARLSKKAERKSMGMSGFGVSPGVRKFAFIGLAILLFSIFYKNHFSVSNVIAEVKHTFTMFSKGKIKMWQFNRNTESEYIDVRTFQDDMDSSR
jgi:hypothetical protein